MTARWLTRSEAAERARRSPATTELLDAYIADGRPGVLRVRRERRAA